MSKAVLVAGGLLVVAAALFYWQFPHRNPPAPTVSAVSSNVADEVVASSSPQASAQSVESTSQSLPALDLDDDRPFAEVRPELEQQARAGDGHAAWWLGMVLSICNDYVPMSDDKLEDIFVDAFASDMFVEGATPDTMMPKFKVIVAQQRHDCRNVSGLKNPDASAQAFQWMELGASLGDADAQAMYAGLAFKSLDKRNALADAERIRERKRLALEYLDRSLAQGDALALLQLAGLHTGGLLVPADAEVAYGYFYAFSLTARARNFVPGYIELGLELTAQGLDAIAQERARAAGRSLATCCMFDTRGWP